MFLPVNARRHGGSAVQSFMSVREGTRIVRRRNLLSNSKTPEVLLSAHGEAPIFHVAFCSDAQRPGPGRSGGPIKPQEIFSSAFQRNAAE